MLNIIDFLMSIHKVCNYIPLPSFTQYIFKKRSVNVLILLLFIENADLSKTVLNLFVKYYICSYSLKHLYDNGIVEALILNLHTKHSKKALVMLERIHEQFPQYNKELGDDDLLKKEEKDSIELFEPDIQEKIKNSILFRFLHSTLVDMYENDDKKTFIDLYKHDKLENEYIIWNEE